MANMINKTIGTAETIAGWAADSFTQVPVVGQLMENGGMGSMAYSVMSGSITHSVTDAVEDLWEFAWDTYEKHSGDNPWAKRKDAEQNWEEYKEERSEKRLAQSLEGKREF